MYMYTCIRQCYSDDIQYSKYSSIPKHYTHTCTHTHTETHINIFIYIFTPQNAAEDTPTTAPKTARICQKPALLPFDTKVSSI